MRTDTTKKSTAFVESGISPTQKFLLTIPEAAEAMNATVWAVRTLIRTGKLKYVPMGQAQLISPKEIQAFIEREQRIHDRAA